MSYPTITNYIDAITNKEYELNGDFDAVLRDDGELHFSAGAFAAVFKLKSLDGYHAMKCFIKESDERLSRYPLISAQLNKLKSKYFVNFKFYDKGIYCNLDKDNHENNYFPLLLMDWVEGRTLGTELKELCAKNDKVGLKKLNTKFRELSEYLLTHKIAHGDLKHDNILVDTKGNLVLVDYDGLFIQDFNGKEQIETGTPSFQHPNRQYAIFDESIDHFSILVIALSLMALCEKPYLFDKYFDEQNIIFTSNDFKNFQNSKIYQELIGISEPLFKGLLFCLRNSITESSISIENLKEILSGKFPEPELDLKIDSTDVLEGENAKIFWVTKSAIKLTFEGKEIDLNGSENIKISTSRKFDFIVSNGYKDIKKSISVTAIPKPSIKYFKIDRAKIKHNDTVKLTFEFNNVSKALLKVDGKEHDVLKQNHFIQKNVDSSFTAELCVIGLKGLGTVNSFVSTEIINPANIDSFESNLNYIIQTKKVKLSWKISNANSAIIVPGDIDCLKMDSIELSPISDTVYKLTARNELFETTKEIKINVLSVQVPRFRFPQPPELSRKKIESIYNRVNISDELQEVKRQIEKAMEVELKAEKKDIFKLFKLSFAKIFKRESRSGNV